MSVEGSPKRGEQQQQWDGDFLGVGGGDGVVHDIGMVLPHQDGDGGSSSSLHMQDYDHHQQHQRPLQLPRVGWGTDDDDDEFNDNSNDDDAQQQNNGSIDLQIPPKTDESSVVSRSAMSRAESDLPSIPEDLSMHGTWPDYYPDILGCYDYDDDRKKYANSRRLCGGPHFKRRLCGAFLLFFVALMGTRVYENVMTGKDNGRPHHNGNDNVGSSNEPQNLENTDMDPEEVYQRIVDTFHPLMFDDTTNKWDGTYFHAYEFCGTEYSRIPCPYVAYCPLGPKHAPLGGTKINYDGSSWAPIFTHDSANPRNVEPDWVQLGPNGTCELYTDLYGESPMWGNVVGGGDVKDVGIARHVMCCLEGIEPDYEEGDGLTSKSREINSGGNIVPSNDPDYVDRPPSMEEDEMEKPIRIHFDGEEDTKGKEDEENGGNRRRARERSRRK